MNMKKFFTYFAWLPLTFLSWVTVQAAEPSSKQGVSSLLSRGGLIPECLRDPESVRTSDISCVTSSITHFTSILLLGVAFGAFVYLLYGAFLYATAFGDEKKVEQGKKSITYALGGVILAILARFLVEAVRRALNA